MSLKSFTLEKSQEWDEIVKSFDNYDVYYLSEYCKAFEIHGDGEPNLIYFESYDLKAINVVMKRDIAKLERFKNEIEINTLFDYSTPYGYGGFLLQGNINENTKKQLNDEYTKYCNDNNIVSEFVRFHPVLHNQKYLDQIYQIERKGLTITIPLKSKEYVWDNLVGKNRNVIRKAQRNGVNIYWGRNKELIKEFKEIYDETMDKDNATEYYYFNDEFYDSVLNDLKNNMLIFYAELENKIIAMSIIMFSNNQLHYHLSSSRKEYLSCAPTNLLLYEAACWGVDNGYSTFHLGGGLGSSEDSLYKFKKSFVKEYEETSFFIGKKIFDMDVYEKLNSGLNVKNISFFPKYRG